MTIPISPEFYRFVLLILIVVVHRFRIVTRIMDRLASSSPKAVHVPPGPNPPSATPPQDSTSPRLYALHRRFRASSNPSSNSAPQPPAATALLPQPASPRDPATRSEAARSAKRFLLSTIRDDWSYPLPTELSAAGVNDAPSREPVEYRHRDEGSSDLDPPSDEPPDARDPMAFTDGPWDPYKFESPDAIATSMRDRRRRRRRTLREEIGWNEGLRTWTERRDAWTGAVPFKPGKNKSAKGNKSKHESSRRTPSSETDVLSLNWPLSPPSSVSNGSLSSGTSPLEKDLEILSERGLFLPIFPPLLPMSNPIRASIKPTAYAQIYSKVVVQGLTPTVPVPLPDMTRSLVQGWKEEGNWPPQGGTPSNPIVNEGGRRGSDLLKFRRARESVMEKGRVRKGVGAVRKALGLASFATSQAEADERDTEPMELGMEFEEEDANPDLNIRNGASGTGRVDG